MTTLLPIRFTGVYEMTSRTYKLLLNLPDPWTLTEAITQAVQYDNRLFEHRQEWRLIQGPYKAKAITPWKQIPNI
jgi:hypothetical protein